MAAVRSTAMRCSKVLRSSSARWTSVNEGAGTTRLLGLQLEAEASCLREDDAELGDDRLVADVGLDAGVEDVVEIARGTELRTGSYVHIHTTPRSHSR
jgi:hypothetical protein